LELIIVDCYYRALAHIVHNYTQFSNMSDIEDDDSEDGNFELYELVFAESIGVNLEEDFAAELLELAVKALYTLPDDWEMEIADSELGKIPFFFNSTTGESQWSHPFGDEFSEVVRERREELYVEYAAEMDDELNGGDNDDNQTAALDDELLMSEEEAKQDIALSLTIAEPQPVDEPVSETEQPQPTPESPQFELEVSSTAADIIVSDEQQRLEEKEEGEGLGAQEPVAVVSSTENITKEESTLTTDPVVLDILTEMVTKIVASEEAESAVVVTVTEPKSELTSEESQAIPEQTSVLPEPESSLVVEPRSDLLANPESIKEVVELAEPEQPVVLETADTVQDVVVEIVANDDESVMELASVLPDNDAESVQSSLTSVTILTTNTAWDSLADLFSIDGSLLAMCSKTEKDIEDLPNGEVDIEQLVAHSLKLDKELATQREKDRKKEIKLQQKQERHRLKEEAKIEKQKALDLELKKQLELQEKEEKEKEEKEKLSALERLRVETERQLRLKEELEQAELQPRETAMPPKKVEHNESSVSDVFQDIQEAAISESLVQTTPVEDIVAQAAVVGDKVEVYPLENSQVKTTCELLSESPSKLEIEVAEESIVNVIPVHVLNILEDERFQNHRPIEPLNKDVDVQEHFRRMFKEPSQPELVSQPGSEQGPRPTVVVVEPDTTKRENRIYREKTKETILSALRAPDESIGMDSKKHKKAQLALNNGSMVKVKFHKRRRPNNNKNNGSNSTIVNDNKWTLLAAYSTYREASAAVRAFESIYPASVPPGAFPVLTKRFHGTSMALPIPPQHNSVELGNVSASFSLLTLSTAVDEKSVQRNIGKPLPRLRIARDLSRMQWLVECSDASAKKVFAVSKRQMAQALSPMRNNGSNGVVGSTAFPSSQLIGGDNLNQSSVFTANFSPQSMISNSNSLHVSSRLNVVYPMPREGLQDGKNKLWLKRRKTFSAGRLAMLPTSGQHDRDTDNDEHNASNERISSPKTFRQVLSRPYSHLR
jgi:hypothetical protein